MENEVYPADSTHHAQVDEGPSRWEPAPIMEELKDKAKAAGLWNVFMPNPTHGPELTNLECAPLAEVMGRSMLGPEPFLFRAIFPLFHDHGVLPVVSLIQLLIIGLLVGHNVRVRKVGNPKDQIFNFGRTVKIYRLLLKKSRKRLLERVSSMPP